ncbi:MAG: SixA phosphatase family protein, partial [Pontibacterium sp.]
MKYFFLRHGQAGWDAPSDAARQLTPKGEHDVCEVIKHHQTQLAGIELIVHSPMVRARQSAYLAGQWLNVSQYVEDIHWTPNRSIEEAYAALETYQNTHILVVG